VLRRVLLSASAVCIFTTGETLAQAVPVPPPVNGEVVKIDQAAGKMTLRHGPIKNLDMDGMTMVFRVADPAMLAKVKAGDRVTFEADRINGALTVTKIDKAR
jgi:Cu(I)/Ag(I) efflux system periplasmic protein CusF